jgi:hypothetical protein
MSEKRILNEAGNGNSILRRDIPMIVRHPSKKQESLNSVS